MSIDRTNCFICRMFRSFAFSGAGALVGGYGALLIGSSKQNAIIAAFLGAMIGVVWMSKKMDKNKKQ